MGSLNEYVDMLDLVEDYLDEFEGDYPRFVAYTKAQQRIGQAFFNSLSQHDQVILRGSFYDPFYRDTPKDLVRCIEWLLFRGK